MNELSRREKIDFIIDSKKDVSAATINTLTLGMSDEELDEFFNNVFQDTKDTILERD